MQGCSSQIRGRILLRPLWQWLSFMDGFILPKPVEKLTFVCLWLFWVTSAQLQSNQVL